MHLSTVCIRKESDLLLMLRSVLVCICFFISCMVCIFRARREVSFVFLFVNSEWSPRNIKHQALFSVYCYVTYVYKHCTQGLYCQILAALNLQFGLRKKKVFLLIGSLIFDRSWEDSVVILR